MIWVWKRRISPTVVRSECRRLWSGHFFQSGGIITKPVHISLPGPPGGCWTRIWAGWKKSGWLEKPPPPPGGDLGPGPQKKFSAACGGLKRGSNKIFGRLRRPKIWAGWGLAAYPPGGMLVFQRLADFGLAAASPPPGEGVQISRERSMARTLTHRAGGDGYSDEAKDQNPPPSLRGNPSSCAWAHAPHVPHHPLRGQEWV